MIKRVMRPASALPKYDAQAIGEPLQFVVGEVDALTGAEAELVAQHLLAVDDEFGDAPR